MTKHAAFRTDLSSEAPRVRLAMLCDEVLLAVGVALGAVVARTLI